MKTFAKISGAPARRVRFARLLAMFAASLAAVTCDLVTAPKPGSAGFTFNYTGSRKIVVGSLLPVEILVEQNGVNLEGARLQIQSSNPDIVSVGGDDFNHTLSATARGHVTLTVTLLGSTLGDIPPFDTLSIDAIAESLQVSTPAITMRALGDTVRVFARVYDHNAVELAGDQGAVRWTSSAPAVATVDNVTGKVTGLTNGSATITGILDDDTARINLTVAQQVAHYTFNPAPVVIGALGATAQITPVPRDSNGNIVTNGGLPTITWASRRPGSFTVSGSGLVTGLLNDTSFAVATASVGGGTVSDSVRVEVGQVATSVIISQSGPINKNAVNDTVNITAVALDARGVAVVGRSILFTSRNSQVARQTATTASGATFALDRTGSAVVAAQLDGAKDSITVNVTNDPITIRTTPSLNLTSIGDTVTVKDSVFNRLGAYLPGTAVSWRALDTTIARVTPATGIVLGVGIGRTSVVGSIAGGGADTTVVDVQNLIAFVDITHPDTSLESIGDTSTVRVDFRNSRGNQVPRSSAVWSSTDSTVVTVSNGFLTALRQGFAAIYATDPLNPARSDSVRVTVTNAPALLTLNRIRDTLTAPSRTLQYLADVRNARGALIPNATVSFRSTNASVASVSASGVATALAVGQTGIIAETGTGAGLRADTALLVVTNDAVGLSVSPTSVTIASVGATTQLVADARNAVGGAVTGVSFTWTTSDPTVATVSNTGVVTGVSVGTATIQAQLAALTATSSITVTNAPDTVQIAPTLITLPSVNDSTAPATRLVNALGASLLRTSAQWLTDDGGVATVTSNGIIIATGRGTTQIRARNPINTQRQDSVTVTVTDAPDSINVVRTIDSLPSLNRTLQYTADVFNKRRAALPLEPITWTSRNTSIATVGSTGLATSVGIGQTYIVGTAGTVTDSALLVVTNRAATVTLSPTFLTLTSLTQTGQLTPVARNELGNVIASPTVTWGSSNSGVASVSLTGLVTAVSVGSATISATVDGLTASIPVTVTNAPTVVTFTSGNITLASVGDQATPSITLQNGLGTVLPRSAVTWTTSNANIFSVSSTGVVTAVAAGSGTLAATSPADNTVTSSITVTVSDAPATLAITPAGPTTLTAIGATQALAATVRNAAGNVIASPNPAVTWSSNNAAVTVNPTTGVATAVSNGSATITATAGTASSTTTITVGQVASAATSTIATGATSLTANGVATTTVTVQLKDASGTNLTASGGTVTMSLSGIGTLGAVTNNANGTYTATLTAPSTLGSASISATVNGTAITTGDKQVAFVAGAATGYIVTASSSSPVAGSQITLSAQQVDANNNPVTTPKTITWSSTGGGSFPSGNTSSTNGSGVATITFTTSTTSGAVHNVLATDGGALSGTSPNVTTIPGAATKFIVTSSASSGTPLSTVSITAQLADANNNAVGQSGHTVTWGSTNGGSFSSATSPTSAAGVASVTFTLSGSASTVHTVSATEALLSGNTTVSVTAPNHYVVSASSYAPQAGASVTITAQLVDASNNPVNQSGLTINWTAANTPSNRPGSFATGTSITNASGAATVVFTTNGTSGTTHAVTATDNAAISGTSPNIVTGAGAATQLVFTTQPVNGTAGTGFGVVVEARDANGNTASGFNGNVTLTRGGGNANATLSGTLVVAASNGVATFTGLAIDSAASNYTLTASINAGAITKVSNTFNIAVGAISPLKSVVSRSAATVAGGSNITLTLSGRDSQGNAVTVGGATVVFTQGGGTSTGTIGSTTDNGNGTYTATFTGGTAGTATTIGATIGGVATTSTATVTVTVGTISAATSTVSTSSATVASGSAVTLTLQAKDGGGNNLTTGGATVVFTQTGGTSTGTISATTDNGNGTYTATFTGVTSGTARTIRATVNAVTTTSSTTVTVNPGPISTATSVVSRSAATVASGSAVTLTLTARDAAGNNLVTGGSTILFTASGGTSTGTIGAVTDNGNGTYTASFTGVLAGTATTIGATINGNTVTSTTTVSVTPGPISAATSVVSAPATVAGGANITLTLTARDAAGNSISTGGATVVFTRSGGTSTGTIGSTTDNGNGTYTAQFTGGTAGTATTIGATVNTVATTSTTPVTVTVGTISAATSTVSRSAASVASGSAVTLTLQAKDGGGNNLATGGATVVFTQSGGTSTGTIGSTTDNGDGTYTATFTGVLAGTARTIGATVNTVATTSTTTVTVTPGPISTATSTVSRSSATVASGSAVTLTLQAKDAAGNNLATGGETVVFTATGGTSTGTIGATTDNGNGTYTASFTGVLAGTATTIGATINTVATTNTTTLTVTPGAISAATSVVSAGAATVSSGSGVTLTLTAKDAAGNSITTGGATVVFTATGGTSTGTIGSTTDNGNGTYTATFTGVLAGTATTIGATVNTVATTSTTTVTVNPGPISAATSVVTRSAASVASGSAVTLTLTAKDAAGNGITTGGATVVFTQSGGTSTGTIGATTDNGNGTYTASFTGVTAGTARTIGATVNTVATTSTTTVTVTPGPITELTSVVSRSAATVAVGGVSNLTLQGKDAAGNNVTAGGATVVFTATGGTSTGTISATTDNGNGTYSATFTGTGAGTATTIGATIGGNATTSTTTIAVFGAIDEATSTVTAPATVVSGAGITLTLQAKDANGNNITSGGATVVFTATGGTSTGTIGATTDNGNGTYTATFTGVLAGTATTIGATINGNATTSTTPVTVTPGAISTATSTVNTSAGSVASGSAVTLTLQAKDAAGNNLTTGGSTIAFTQTGGTSTGTIGAVTDNGNGTYTASFTGVLAGTARTIGATIGGNTVTSTTTVSVTPGTISAATSVVTSASTVGSGSGIVLLLTGKDAAGNSLTTGGATVVFTNSGGTSTGLISATTDNGDGTYTATFTGQAAGTATTVRATVNTVQTTSSQSVTVTPGVADHLTFTTQPPSTVTRNVAFTVVVAVKDAFGNTITSDNSTVITVAINTDGSSGSNATLSGTKVLTVASGSATFSTLSINRSGTNYDLKATSSPAYTQAISTQFDIP